MFKSIGAFLRTLFRYFTSKAEPEDPEAVLEAEKEKLREQVTRFNEQLAVHAAHCEQLMKRLRRLRDEEERLRAETTAALEREDRTQAAKTALELKTLRAEAADLRARLEEAEATYRSMIESRDLAVGRAKERIERLGRGVTDMRMQQSLAELNEMSADMMTGASESASTLDRLQQTVDGERSAAAGRARAAGFVVETDARTEAERERDLLGKQALAEFAAEEGLDAGLPEDDAPEDEAAGTDATSDGRLPE